MTEVENQTSGVDDNGIFLAYDKVLYTQYADYAQYATLVPGPDTLLLANSIRGEAYNDKVVKDLNEALYMYTYNAPIPFEYYLMVIRDASGDLFDIYLSDEDGLFIGCAAHIAYDDVISQAKHLAETVGVTYNT